MINKSTNYLWLSLGENCLPDDILKGHEKKSFSTLFSSGRSNIDYILSLESSGYENLLDLDNLIYGDAWGTKVVRSKNTINADDIYDPGCSKGFEFTHHNPIDSQKDRESLMRKISRLKSAKLNDNIIFLYHHRKTNKSDLEKIRQKLRDFQSRYQNDEVKCSICLFYQSVMAGKADRRIHATIHDTFMEFDFHTEYVWGGNDANIFWAVNDDDLILNMIKNIEDHISSI